MTDEAAVDTEDQAPEPEQQVDQAEQPKGHMSKEAWEEQGHNPDDWRSPREFQERGELIKQVQSLKHQATQSKQDTDVQIRNLNLLHQQAQAQTIKDLESKRDKAIDEADSEQANQIQGEIDQTRQTQFQTQAQIQQAPQAQAKDPQVTEWEEKNQWINNPNDPKTPYAMQQYRSYLSQNYTEQQALAALEGDLSRAFPNVNSARNNAATSEAGGGPGRTRGASSRSVTMDSLTNEEASIWKSVGKEQWKTEADFLKAVANSRKGA